MADLSLVKLSAVELAARMRTRELSPVAVLEAHLAAIAQVNPTLNAICTLAAEQAMAAARALEAELARGAEPGLLAGLPVGTKDMVDTAGIRTTYGCPLFKDHVPTFDALIAQRIKQAGGVIVGKTNVPEFAAGANTYNPIFGPTRNPWNPALSASGSTGGGAAGLASRMFALADGSDLGGSLRTPAAFCGVVGLRPTPGLVPRWPDKLPFEQLSVMGPMGRNVADTALFLQAIAGPSPLAPLYQPIAGRDFLAAARPGQVRGLRIAYCPDIAGIGIEPGVEAACRAAVFALRDAGAVVEEIAFDLAYARKAFIQLRGQLMINSHLDLLDRIDQLGPNLAGNLRLGLAQGPRDVALGERGRMRLVEQYRGLFARFDALATATAPVPPFPVEQNYPETIAGKKMETYIDWVAPTFLVTMAAIPAISVPCGLADGLPVGLQIAAPSGCEERVLALAAQVENDQPMPMPAIIAG
jgi:amidase